MIATMAVVFRRDGYRAAVYNLLVAGNAGRRLPLCLVLTTDIADSISLG